MSCLRPKINAHTTSLFEFTGSFTIQTAEVPSSASFGESLRTRLSQTEESRLLAFAFFVLLIFTCKSSKITKWLSGLSGPSGAFCASLRS